MFSIYHSAIKYIKCKDTKICQRSLYKYIKYKNTKSQYSLYENWPTLFHFNQNQFELYIFRWNSWKSERERLSW